MACASGSPRPASARDDLGVDTQLADAARDQLMYWLPKSRIRRKTAHAFGALHAGIPARGRRGIRHGARLPPCPITRPPAASTMGAINPAARSSLVRERRARGELHESEVELPFRLVPAGPGPCCRAKKNRTAPARRRSREARLRLCVASMRPPRQMPEHPGGTVNTMADALAGSASATTVRVLHRPAGLDDRAHARIGRVATPSGRERTRRFASAVPAGSCPARRAFMAPRPPRPRARSARCPGPRAPRALRSEDGVGSARPATTSHANCSAVHSAGLGARRRDRCHDGTAASVSRWSSTHGPTKRTLQGPAAARSAAASRHESQGSSFPASAWSASGVISARPRTRGTAGDRRRRGAVERAVHRHGRRTPTGIARVGHA